MLINGRLLEIKWIQEFQIKMIELIKNNIETIQDVCKKHQVISLYLFGSAVDESKFTQQSDIDFLYEIETENFNNINNYDYIDNLNDLENSLNSLLSRKIDLVPYKYIHNRIFKQNVDKSSVLIYEKH